MKNIITQALILVTSLVSFPINASGFSSDAEEIVTRHSPPNFIPKPCELDFALKLSCDTIQDVHKYIMGKDCSFHTFHSPTHPIAGWVVDTKDTLYIAFNDSDIDLSRVVQVRMSERVGTISLGLKDIGTANKMIYGMAIRRADRIGEILNSILKDQPDLMKKRTIVAGFGVNAGIAQIYISILRKKWIEAGFSPAGLDINGIFFSAIGPFDKTSSIEMGNLFEGRVIYFDINRDQFLQPGSRILQSYNVVIDLTTALSTAVEAAAEAPKELLSSIAECNVSKIGSIVWDNTKVLSSYLYGGLTGAAGYLVTGAIHEQFHWIRINKSIGSGDLVKKITDLQSPPPPYEETCLGEDDGAFCLITTNPDDS